MDSKGKYVDGKYITPIYKLLTEFERMPVDIRLRLEELWSKDPRTSYIDYEYTIENGSVVPTSVDDLPAHAIVTRT